MTGDGPARRSFEQRYGSRIAACGIAPIPSLLIKWGCSSSIGLSPRELIYCLLVLEKRWGGDEWPYLSNFEAGEALNVHERKISEIKSSLKERGLAIFSEATKGNGRRGADRVDLSPLLAALEEVAEYDRVRRSLHGMAKRRAKLPDLPEERSWARAALPKTAPLNRTSPAENGILSPAANGTTHFLDLNSRALPKTASQEEKKKKLSYPESCAAAQDESFSFSFAPAVGVADATQAELPEEMIF